MMITLFLLRSSPNDEFQRAPFYGALLEFWVECHAKQNNLNA
jgi:hypothetical protein